MGHRTPLYQTHANLGAKLVDFGGWDMPLHYGSQLQEHTQVRGNAGMFDVSHMTIVDVTGADAEVYLRHLLANDVAKLAAVPGKALYTAMLNYDAGVIDDLIVYRLDDSPVWYRTVVNCATRERDLQWMQSVAKDFAVTVAEQPALAMVAVQGPNAIAKVVAVLPQHQAALTALKPFQAVVLEDWFLSRTGYTGEDGLEVILPAKAVVDFWQQLLDAGVAPCGLGARDTLRLEAGMNLYGHEMDEAVSPLAANMAWTVAWEPAERDFIGRTALERIRAAGGSEQILVGLALKEKGVLRAHQTVVLPESDKTGEITSGTFSPTLGFSIAMARIPVDHGQQAMVEVRNKRLAVDIVKPCFVRQGKKLI